MYLYRIYKRRKFSKNERKTTHLYPVRMFKRVDFPAPEGPIIAVSSPDRSLPLTDFKIVFTSKD